MVASLLHTALIIITIININFFHFPPFFKPTSPSFSALHSTCRQRESNDCTTTTDRQTNKQTKMKGRHTDTFSFPLSSSDDVHATAPASPLVTQMEKKSIHLHN